MASLGGKRVSVALLTATDGRNSQHNKVGDGKLESVQKSPDGLLEDVGAEAGDRSAGSRGEAVDAATGAVIARALGGLSSGGGDGGGGRVGLNVLPGDELVVFLAGAAESFEKDDEEKDANAGASKGASSPDVPASGDEARVDGVPVPQHLKKKMWLERSVDWGIVAVAHGNLAAPAHVHAATTTTVIHAAHAARRSGGGCGGSSAGRAAHDVCHGRRRHVTVIHAVHLVCGLSRCSVRIACCAR
jgi:hypothetical protein